MSFQKYRLIDITIFSILYFIFEYLVQKAAIDWFPDQPFSVSLMLPMLLLLIMRWDYFASPLFIIFGFYYVLIYTLISGTNHDINQYAIYVVGNVSLIIITILLKKIGKEKITKKAFPTIAYCMISYIVLEVFRSVGAMIFTNVGIEIFIQYIFIDLLNLLFTLIIILIARNVNGLFEDQKSYLIRINKENN